MRTRFPRWESNPAPYIKSVLPTTGLLRGKIIICFFAFVSEKQKQHILFSLIVTYFFCRNGVSRTHDLLLVKQTLLNQLSYIPFYLFFVSILLHILSVRFPTLITSTTPAVSGQSAAHRLMYFLVAVFTL